MLRADYKSRLVSYKKKKKLSFARGLTLVADCDWSYAMEAIINCDNYGGAITFNLTIPEEKKREEREEKDDNWEEKKTKSSEIIMKSSARVCLFRKSREWKEYSESRNSRVDVYRRWNMKLMEIMKINT